MMRGGDSSPGHIDAHLRTAIFVHRIVRPERDLVDALGNAHAGERAGERLLVFVRMGELTGAKNRTIGANDVPFVGIVIPSGITVPDGNVEAIGAGRFLRNSDIDNIGLAGGCANCAKQQGSACDNRNA